MALLILLTVCFLLMLAVRRKKHIAPTRTEEQQTDELVAVILPTINNDH